MCVVLLDEILEGHDLLSNQGTRLLDCQWYAVQLLGDSVGILTDFIFSLRLCDLITGSGKQKLACAGLVQAVHFEKCEPIAFEKLGGCATSARDDDRTVATVR